MKEQVRPYYEALKGCLSSLPITSEQSYILESEVWEEYHSLLDKLSAATHEDLGSKKLSILTDERWSKVSVQAFRTKLNSLIMELYGKYFKDEPAPFSGAPGVLVQQSQSQSQQLQIQIITEVQSLIDKQLFTTNLPEKEKSFLEKLKENLPTIKTTTELIQAVIRIASSLGLEMSQVAKSLGL